MCPSEVGCVAEGGKGAYIVSVSVRVCVCVCVTVRVCVRVYVKVFYSLLHLC